MDSTASTPGAITIDLAPDPRRTWAAGPPPIAALRLQMPAAVLDELRSCLGRWPELLDEPASLPFIAAEWPSLCRFALELRRGLRHREGVRLVTPPPGTDLGRAERRLLYLASARALGTVMTQYGALYEVRDRGVDYQVQTVPVSQTRAPTGFHTDSSARDALPDFVGLLCEQPAVRGGGDSRFANALRIFAEMRRESPELLAALERSYVRDVVTPGAGRDLAALLHNRFPVFERVDGGDGVLFRYMRFWIERGHRHAELPLDPRALAAFDRLDELLERPDNRLELRLGTGDMVWVDNRVFAHDRSGYEDDPAQPRVLLRTWVRLPPPAGDRAMCARR